MTTLLIEPFGGMAGDMFLAALLDLGDERFCLEDLQRLADQLLPGDVVLESSRAKRGAFVGTHLDVRTPESHDPPHRHLADLVDLLARVELPRVVRERAASVLDAIAEAEGRVHGIAKEKVHFHEVGAVDTLIDVVGAVFAMHKLGVDRVLATAPLVGSGTVICAHGEMPVPVPAVAELMRDLPLRYGGEGERLTPTAAAILSVLVDEFDAQVVLQARLVGLGAGTRDPQSGPPNLVRVQLCEQDAIQSERQETWQLDVHLDDATGEELGWCLRALREAGALDAWSSALQMKKDRPGVQISALCRAEQRSTLEAVIFERTPSLGLRWTRVERTECERKFESVEIEGFTIRVKIRQRPQYKGRSPFGERDISPEYDDLVPLAEHMGWSLREAERRVIAARGS